MSSMVRQRLPTVLSREELSASLDAQPIAQRADTLGGRGVGPGVATASTGGRLVGAEMPTLPPGFEVLARRNPSLRDRTAESMVMPVEYREAAAHEIVPELRRSH
jgi:hypothetical protein